MTVAKSLPHLWQKVRKLLIPKLFLSYSCIFKKNSTFLNRNRTPAPDRIGTAFAPDADKTKGIMEKVIHRAATRGYFDHGWLQTFHTFSFADYYNPQRIHFGALRVLNDDTVAGGEGFGSHPHDNMEIVSIPLSGELRHEDSMGHGEVLRPGEIQVMSAGTGIVHSEFNNLPDREVKFLQIWIFPDRDDLTPRYEQIRLAKAEPDRLRPIVAPKGEGGEHVGWIHQKAWLSTLDLTSGAETDYELHGANHGVYLFVLEGVVEAAGETLRTRDGMGIRRTERVALRGIENSHLLLIEVPM